MRLDTSFDFRTDTPRDRDPDSHSPMLRRCHQVLWSKPLPSGAMFALEASGNDYLRHDSSLGRFRLSSDTVVPTFRKRMERLGVDVPVGDLDRFQTSQHSIGGMLVWPANRVDGRQTINGARGFRAPIADRFDLTLECVRRHYAGDSSPLSDVLARYPTFFDLFDDFVGYVDFFLLQDLVSPEAMEVRFLMPFDGFGSPAYPRDADTYVEYMHRAVGFLEARNRRIDALAIEVDT